MNSLREGMLQAGLVSAQRFSEVEEAEKIRTRVRESIWRDEILRKEGRSWELDRLLSARTVKDFRKVAREVLTRYPDMIREVVTVAQALKHEPGGKPLVWQVYQVRDHISVLNDETREKFLACAFGRNGLGYLAAIKK